MSVPGAWQDSAACKGMPADLFFRDKWGPTTLPMVEDVCRACPVRADCLDYALENNETLGYWGGTTPEQRALMLDPHRDAPLPTCAEAGCPSGPDPDSPDPTRCRLHNLAPGRTMANRGHTCSIPGCERLAVIRGMCNRHYQQARREGTIRPTYRTTRRQESENPYTRLEDDPPNLR